MATPSDDGEPDPFELFWENSCLTPALLPGFAARIASAPPPAAPRLPTYAGPDFHLPRPRDQLARLFEQRCSTRRFGDGRVGIGEVGALLAGLSGGRRGHRAFPSAGALYPLEVFCLARHVAAPLGGNILAYNPDNHSVSTVRSLPHWEEVVPALSLVEDTAPPLVLVFVIFADRMLDRYGQRGGRFALIEVGHAAQNVALRLGREKMVGYELGGLVDSEMLRLLGLDGTEARVALGYACGLRP